MKERRSHGSSVHLDCIDIYGLEITEFSVVFYANRIQSHKAECTQCGQGFFLKVLIIETVKLWPTLYLQKRFAQADNTE